MSDEVREFRKAAVMGGFLSRAGELGLTPTEVERCLIKTAGMGAAVIAGELIPPAITIGAAGSVAPYYAGKAIGGAGGSATHSLSRSLNRLDDPDLISLKRRLIQVLQMNRGIESDLSSRGIDPASRSGHPAGERAPSKAPQQRGGLAELTD